MAFCWRMLFDRLWRTSTLGCALSRTTTTTSAGSPSSPGPLMQLSWQVCYSGMLIKTLLSGPPHATILAGAAHCYSPGDSPSSYRVIMSTVLITPKSIKCQSAMAYTLQVTCGEHSLRSRDDHEVVLQVTDVIVHPRWWILMTEDNSSCAIRWWNVFFAPDFFLDHGMNFHDNHDWLWWSLPDDLCVVAGIWKLQQAGMTLLSTKLIPVH